MKKVILAAFFLAGMAELFAYNPPYGGEDLYRLAHPELMSGAASAAGGPNFTIVPASITYNPALTAGVQRADIDFSGHDAGVRCADRLCAVGIVDNDSGALL